MERKNPFVPLDPRALPPEGDRPLEVVLLRGTAVESRHRVHCVVSDAGGQIVRQWGDPMLGFFPRSSVKFLQCAAWSSLGGYDRWKIGSEELALACGSHGGEPVHTKIVEQWLERLQLKVSDLECGTHEPNHRPSSLALAREGKKACPIHNNCSGKHCGLLTACLANGWPVAGYSNYDHPLQERIRRVMGEFMGLDLGSVPWGIDGCGIPSYQIPLGALALAMARTADPSRLSSQIQKALPPILRAVGERPELIGGEGNFSSKVVAETEGRVFAKVGAEGVFGAWIPAEGWGIAIKSECGTVRAAEAAVAAVFRELGHPVSFYSPLVRRWSGEVVGQILCG